jgi:hypothetical protein
MAQSPPLPGQTQHWQSQSEPPLGVLAVITTALFVAGLIISTLLAGGEVFPSPFGSAADALTYFATHPDAVRVGATLQFASTIPLVIYAATAAARLNTLGLRATGATVTLAGGVLAAAFLACSAIVTWVLTVPEVIADPALVRALHTLAFLLGGPGNVVSAGLLIVGLALSGVLGRAFGPRLGWSGVLIGAIAGPTILTFTLTGAAFLLPIARFAGLAWLIAAGFVLPTHRPHPTAVIDRNETE